MFDGLMHHFLITVHREVVASVSDVRLGDTETLRCSGSLSFSFRSVLPTSQHVWQVVLCVFVSGQPFLGSRTELFVWQQWRSLVVQTPAVRVQVVEPNEVCATGVCLRERQNGGCNTCVWAEHATWQRNHSVKLLVFDQHSSQLFMRLRCPEQHTVRHDNCRPAAWSQQSQKQCQKQEFRLLRFDDLQQVLGSVLVIERPCERRIGKDQSVFLFLPRVVLCERIAV